MFDSNFEAATYLSGIVDGEGHLSLDLRKGVGRRRIEITNTDLGIVTATVAACEQLDVSPNVRDLGMRKGATKQAWLIEVGSRPGILRLAQVLKLRSLDKAATLQKMADSYALHQPNTRLFRKDWPLDEVLSMLDAGASRSDMCAHFHRTDGAIGEWKKAALATRKIQGEAG